MPTIPSMATSARCDLPPEGSGENKGLSEKMESDKKGQILSALKDGQSRLDSNPEAVAEETKK